MLDGYKAFTVGETVFVTPDMARDLCAPDRGELDLLFSFEHMETDQYYIKWLKREFRPKPFFEALIKWQRELPWNAIYLENHDQPRSIPRFGCDGYWRESGKLLATLLLTLRGTPFLYQGQEIGMVDFDFDGVDQLDDVESRNVNRILTACHVPERLKWKIIARTSRDNARTPMQWDDGPNAGFTTADRAWLGVNRNYHFVNLADQERDPDSIWSWYKDLSALRRQREALRRGDFLWLEATHKVFVYRRCLGAESVTVALNFSSRPARVGSRGTLLRSNYRREGFDGRLSPWEAVILEDRAGEP